MANAAPATLTITGSTGAGQAVTSQKFTDVVDVEVDFVKNTLKVTRAGGTATPNIAYYDYSALGTVTWTISAGLSTIVMS